MNDMAKSMLGFLGLLFGALVLGFTGFQTWSLLHEVSGNPFIAALGLVLFEGSMVYWWLFFQTKAEGLLQMGLSLLVAIFGLILVAGATALHLGAIDRDLLGQQTPARLVTVAAIVNLIAKFLMPLLHPDVMKRIYKKALTGKVLNQTFAQFETKVKEVAVELADEVAEDWKEDIRQEILALHLSRPGGLLLTGEEATVIHAPTPAPDMQSVVPDMQSVAPETGEAQTSPKKQPPIETSLSDASRHNGQPVGGDVPFGPEPKPDA